MKEDCLQVRGVVVEKYQAHQYKVKLDGGHFLFGQLNGKMCSRKIWCQVGDVVMLEISTYDLSKGRIFRRM